MAESGEPRPSQGEVDSSQERLTQLAMKIREELKGIAGEERFAHSDATYLFLPIEGESPLGGNPEAEGLKPLIKVTDYRTMHIHNNRDVFGVNNQESRVHFYEDPGPDGLPNIPMVSIGLDYQGDDGNWRDFAGEEKEGGGILFRPCDLMYEGGPIRPSDLGLTEEQRHSKDFVLSRGTLVENPLEDPLLQALATHFNT